MGTGQHRDVGALPFLFDAYGLARTEWWEMLERLQALSHTHDRIMRQQMEDKAAANKK